VGLLSSEDGGACETCGADGSAASGNMWGDDGAPSAGVASHGLGGVGTLGHGDLNSSVHLRMTSAQVSGPLSKKTLDGTMHQNFGRFRLCYQNGLRANPGLQGIISTRFTIDADGSVSGVADDTTTTISDSSVVACIERGIVNIHFTESAAASNVTYAIAFLTK
jgi:hypothetical protein